MRRIGRTGVFFTAIAAFLFLVLRFQTGSAGIPSPKVEIPLTVEERSWLAAHPSITVGQDPSWPPMEFADEHGRQTGIANDYLQLVEQKLNVSFERIRSRNWQETYVRLKRHELDMTTCVAETPERLQFWKFTKPYLTIPIAIFAQSDVPYIHDMRELAGKKIAVVGGYAVNEWIARDHPDIPLVRVKNAGEGFKALREGRVFAYLDNMLVGGYYLAKLGLTDVKIAGETPYRNAQSMAVRSDWPIFVSIVQKALDSISEAERAAVYQKWVPVRYEHGFDYGLFWRLAPLIAAVVLLLFIWNRRLIHEVRARKDTEKALREGELRYQNLMEHSPVAVYVNRNDRVVLANKACAQLFGAERPEQLLGKTPYELFHPDFHEQIRNRIRILQTENRPVPTVEEKIVTLDGRVVDVEVAAAPFRDQGVSAFHVVLSDITERKRAEEELRYTHARLRRFIDSNIVGIVIVNAAGNVIETNDYYLNLIGFTREEFEAGEVDWRKITPPEWIHADEHALRELRRHGTSMPYEKEYVRRDGTRVPVFIADALLPGPNEEIAGFILDMTGPKKAEEQLRRSEEKYRSIFENVQDVYYEAGVDGTILDLSPSIETISKGQYKRSELIGRSMYEFYADAKERHALLEALKSRGSVTDFEISLKGKDGSLLSVALSAKLRLDAQGRPEKIIGSMRDIGQRKKMEEELIKAHKLDSLGILAGGIAHDFNNILTGIMGNISMVRHAMQPADASLEILTEAEKAVLQAKSLTMQLLTFSKGGVPVKRPAVLSSLITEAALFASRGSKIKPEFRISPDLSLVNVDTGQLTQVINNIVINAVQAMPQGGDVLITAENVDAPEKVNVSPDGGRYVRIVIKDSGPGIPPEHRGKIFDPYFTTKKTGSGLGLAASYSIIKNHGGHIAVETEVGKGTSLIIYLPAFTGTADIPAPEKKEARAGSGRVLVLDDEKMICAVIKKMLAMLGYEAECVMDGDLAIRRYRETLGTPGAFGAVILDLTVPGGKGGRETMDELKKLDPRIKAVVSSGYSNDPVMASFREYGFSASLSKPYNIEEVSDILGKLFSGT